MSKPSDQSTSLLAPIHNGVVYPLTVFQQATGLDKAALRAMRRAGFQVRRVGRRSYVLGDDFLAYCREHGELVSG